KGSLNCIPRTRRWLTERAEWQSRITSHCDLILVFTTEGRPPTWHRLTDSMRSGCIDLRAVRSVISSRSPGKKFRMTRRVAVRDSKRVYRGAMQTKPLSQYRALAMTKCYFGPSLLRTGKTAQEWREDGDVDRLADLVNLVDLTEDSVDAASGDSLHFCVPQSQKSIMTPEVSRVIKRAAIRTRQDPDRFSTHSIRIGGDTAFLNSDADRLIIQLLGRWLSSAFEDYQVLTAQGSSHLSRMMCV
ncbi:hypothetical protein JG687_00019381, partial [Phytophthora cactorum]